MWWVRHQGAGHGRALSTALLWGGEVWSWPWQVIPGTSGTAGAVRPLSWTSNYVAKDEPNQPTLQQGPAHFSHFPGVSKFFFFFFLHFTTTKNKFVFFQGQGSEQNTDSNESMSGKAAPRVTGAEAAGGSNPGAAPASHPQKHPESTPRREMWAA